jgi:hypothetical protein
MPWRQLRRKVELERQLLVGRQRLKRAANRLGNVLNAVIGEFENQLAGLDLGDQCSSPTPSMRAGALLVALARER